MGFVYDKATFKQMKTFSYPGEGWGLTHDGARLIMSDGSAALRFLDPSTLKESGRVTVRDNGVAVQRSERAGVRQGRDSGERLADVADRADLTKDRGRDRVD